MKSPFDVDHVFYTVEIILGSGTTEEEQQYEEELEEEQPLIEEDEGYRQALFNAKVMDPAEYYSYQEPPVKETQAPAAAIPPIAIPVDDGQHIKLVQQGALDIERSFTQLAKVDVILVSQAAKHETKVGLLRDQAEGR